MHNFLVRLQTSGYFINYPLNECLTPRIETNIVCHKIDDIQQNQTSFFSEIKDQQTRKNIALILTVIASCTNEPNPSLVMFLCSKTVITCLYNKKSQSYDMFQVFSK